MLLLSQVPTMISPEDDNGIIGMRTALQRIEDPAYLRIGKTYCGVIGLDRPAPLPVCHHVCMITIWLHREVSLSGRVINLPGQLLPEKRNVIEVPFPDRWQLNPFKWMEVEIFPGNAPVQMRLGQPAGQEKRFFPELPQL